MVIFHRSEVNRGLLKRQWPACEQNEAANACGRKLNAGVLTNSDLGIAIFDSDGDDC